jgi:hypothetical protein
VSASAVDTEPLITGTQLAKELRRPPSTVRLWTVRGYIPAIRMPGDRTRYLYRLSAVEAALAAYATGPADEADTSVGADEQTG